MAGVVRSGGGLVALFKRGWHEIPEVMAGGLFGLIGIGMISYGVIRNTKEKRDFKQYRFTYTVYRPDDPRVKNIRA